jgi:CRP/FNR family cyclic AMP-dependent transcriptional regulator
VKTRRNRKRIPAPGAKSYNFFAHVVFALEARAHAAPQATANMLIEVADTAVTKLAQKKSLKVSALINSQKIELAREIAMTAARKYLKSQPRFRGFPAQRCVNFDFIRPNYISIRPPPTRVLPDKTRLWRLAQTEADKLRGEPLSVRYPDIEKRLAAHPFLKGMASHHLELLALCSTPTDFEPAQTIFLEGEPANGFYLIETGTVVLEGKTADGKSVIIDTVTAGQALGWSWLFAPYLWHFDARATEWCNAICLSGILLRQHRDDDLTLSNELFKRVSEVVVRRLQATRSKLVSAK